MISYFSVLCLYCVIYSFLSLLFSFPLFLFLFLFPFSFFPLLFTIYYLSILSTLVDRSNINQRTNIPNNNNNNNTSKMSGNSSTVVSPPVYSDRRPTGLALPIGSNYLRPNSPLRTPLSPSGSSSSYHSQYTVPFSPEMSPAFPRRKGVSTFSSPSSSPFMGASTASRGSSNPNSNSNTPHVMRAGVEMDQLAGGIVSPTLGRAANNNNNGNNSNSNGNGSGRRSPLMPRAPRLERSTNVRSSRNLTGASAASNHLLFANPTSNTSAANGNIDGNAMRRDIHARSPTRQEGRMLSLTNSFDEESDCMPSREALATEYATISTPAFSSPTLTKRSKTLPSNQPQYQPPQQQQQQFPSRNILSKQHYNAGTTSTSNNGDTGAVPSIKTGWLKKLKGFLWKRYYAKLCDGKFSYYKKEAVSINANNSLIYLSINPFTLFANRWSRYHSI